MPTQSPHKKYKENVYKSSSKIASPVQGERTKVLKPPESEPADTTHGSRVVDPLFRAGGYMPWEENEFADITYGRNGPDWYKPSGNANDSTNRVNGEEKS
ncbi:hypothetical protein ABW21_db0208903 [Orbilia brochopaga]|nr:hypothetical protein ABW21_db0208903 [Drechslerella brochopaga]